MIENDIQQGKPHKVYTASYATITGTSAVEGMIACDSTNHALGLRTNTTWEWLMKLDQTTPQTIINGVPLMTTDVDGDGSVSQLVNKKYVDLAVSSIELTEYFSAVDLSPDVGTYLSMDNAQAAAGSVQSVAITGTTGSPTALFKFLTPVGHPHLDRFLAGVYEAHVHLKKNLTGANMVGLRFKIYQCNASGTQTALLATSADISGFTDAYLPYEVTASVATETALATTDRLSVEWFGWVIAGSSSNYVTIEVGGTANSHIGIEISSSELQAIFVPYTGAEHDIDLGAHTITTTGHISAGHLHLGDLAAITTAAESWIGPSSTDGIYFKGGNVGIGTASPNITAWVKALTVYSAGATGLECASSRTNDGGTIGGFGFALDGNIAGHKEVGGIYGFVSGATATKQGSAVTIWTKADNGAVAERMRINSTGNVGIGTATPDAYAILDLTSTTKAFLPPRMTTTQRDAMTPTAGMIIWNTTTATLNFYRTSWIAI